MCSVYKKNGIVLSIIVLLLFSLSMCVLSSCGDEHEHEYGEWIITQKATCTENGLQERACACGEKETKEIPLLGHDDIWGKCTRCNCILDDYNSLFVFELISEYHTFCSNDSEVLEKGTYYVKAFLSNDHFEVLAIPSEYNGIPVTAVNSNLLSNKYVDCIIFPSTITCVGINLCGGGCSCPLLSKIICLSNKPFALGSYALDSSQIAGGCKIYVPSDSVYLYQESHSAYSHLITPLNELDDTILEKIQFRFN